LFYPKTPEDVSYVSYQVQAWDNHVLGTGRFLRGCSTAKAMKFWQYPLVNIQKNYGKLPFLMAESTISMVIFNSYVNLPKGNLV
jgi:hypothetical protein